jgi:hypothetical protein
MPKGWQIKACGRYRPLFGFCVCLTLMLATIIAMGIVGYAIMTIMARDYDKKIGSLVTGTEERDLIRIVGNPDSKVNLKSEDIAWMPGDLKSQHSRFVIYSYSLGSFFYHDLLRSHDIYLDGENRRIVWIRPRIAFWVFIARAQILPLIILLMEAPLCWLGIKWWCKKKLKPI